MPFLDEKLPFLELFGQEAKKSSQQKSIRYIDNRRKAESTGRKDQVQ